MYYLLFQAAEEAGKTGTMVFYLFLSAVGGAAIKAFVDHFLNRRKTDADIIKIQSDVHVSETVAKKNESDIIVETQKLLLDMGERLDVWIRKFETASVEAAKVDDELRQMRRICDDCIQGRTSNYAFCMKVKEFFIKLEPVIATLEDKSMITEFENLRTNLIKIQTDFERDMKIVADSHLNTE